MATQKTTDMTTGPILKHMTSFALPILAGLLFQRIYNFADAFIVGRYLGDNALAAVSVSGVMTYLLFSLMMGITTGVGVVVSQYYGAKREDKLELTFSTSIVISGVSIIALTLLGLCTTDILLKIMHTPPEIMQDAATYLNIIYLGSFATMLFNWISCILRSVGNSSMPLISLCVSTVLNILLDILFVAIIPLGVAGAAIATVLAQLIAGIICLVYSAKILPDLKRAFLHLRTDANIVGLILRYGVSTALQMSIISISDMTLQGVVNSYGKNLVLGYGIGVKVEILCMQLADAIGAAMCTFAGQNMGANDLTRIKKGVHCATLMNLVSYGICSSTVFILAPWIMRFFTQNQSAILYGTQYMRVFSPFLFALGILIMFHNLLRAVGDIPTTLAMGGSEVITRVSFAFLFSSLFGYHGLWWVSPLTWCVAALLGFVRYRTGGWSHNKIAVH